MTAQRHMALLCSATLIAVFALLPSAPYAHAQFVLPSIEKALSITLTPAHPSPGESVRLEARSSAYDLSQSVLTWRVNGKAFASGEGATSADVVAGSLGSEINVSVEAVAPDGTKSSARAAIVPTSIDLLWESDSYVPPFYEGRALPSAGTVLRLQAAPHFRSPGGGELPASGLTYTWRRNDEVIASVSGRGKFTATIPAPALFGVDVISVEAASFDGAFSGEASARIPSTEPTLALYENHPLFGILYNRALGGETLIPDSEMTFAAIPYFAEARSPNDRALNWSWRVNGEGVAGDQRRPSELTVSAQNSNGFALLSLELMHLTNVFLQASGSWGITLSARAGASDLLRGAQYRP